MFLLRNLKFNPSYLASGPQTSVSPSPWPVQVRNEEHRSSAGCPYRPGTRDPADPSPAAPSTRQYNTKEE